MKNYTNPLLPVILLLAMTSCTGIKKLVNKEFEPLTVKEQQLRAINESSINIDSLAPNISIHIGKEILDSLLVEEIEKAAMEMSDSSVTVHSFKPIIKLEKQAIVIDAEFSASFAEIESKLEGRVQGFVGVSSVKDTLFFLPALKTLKITDISFITKKPKLRNRAVAALIRPVARHFLDNLSGQLLDRQISLYTGWGETTEVETGELFTNDETVVNGPVVEIGRYVKSSSWLIDKRGVSVLIELENSQDTKQPDSTSSQSQQANVDALFKDYQAKFNTIWLQNFQPYSDSVRLSVGVTKKTLADIFNEVLSTSTLTVSQAIDIPKETSKDDLEIDRLKLDCNSVRESFSFPGFSYGSNCNYSCMKKIKVRIGPIKITKRIDDPICGAGRAACKAARETARIAWQTSRETARIAHQVYNEGKVAACKIAVEASELVDLGIIETSSGGSGKATLRLSAITINDDLSSLKFNTKGNVSLTLNSFLGLYPQDVGHLVMCTIDYRKSISTKLKGDIFTQLTEINLVAKKINEDIVLTGITSPIGYKAKADMSPLHELLIDPQLAVKCPLLYSTLLSAGVTGGVAAVLGLVDNPELQLLLKGSAVGEYTLEPFTQTLSPITFSLNEQKDLKSTVEWAHGSIEFSY